MSYSNGIYFTYWVFVITAWSDRDYTFWTNALNTAMCITGVIAGLVLKYTHGYKWPMMFHPIVRSTGTALSFAATYHPHTPLLVIYPIFVGIGAAFSTIGAMVGVQASVPHTDLAIAAAVLSLITSTGGSCGGAIGAFIWTEKLPAALAQIDGINAMIAARMYGDIRIARAAEPRDQVIRAYLDTAWYHELPALLIGMIPIVFGCLTVDFHFGESQNAIETDKRVVMKSAEEVTDEKILMLTQEAERSATAKAADGAGVAA